MTKTVRRFGLISLLVVCLVTAAGVAAMRGTYQWPHAKQNLATSDELVTFRITLDPVVREETVTITVMMGDKTVVDTTMRSPWVYEAMLSPGTPVTLSGVQIDDGEVRCLIRKGLKRIDEQVSQLVKRAVVCKGST